MSIAVIRSLDAMEALAPAWSRLQASSPFATWTFVQGWLAHFRATATPFVIVQTDAAGELVGVAPWAIVAGRNGARRLTGVGGADAGYHDPVVRAPGDLPAFSGLVASALRKHRKAWDILALTLRPEASSPLLEALPHVGWSLAATIPWEQHSVIAMPGGWEPYLADRARRFDDARRRERKLAQVPHRYYLASPDEADAALTDLFRLHAANLAGKGDWEHLYGFLRSIAATAVASGDAIVLILEIEGRRAAIDMLLRAGPVAYGLLRAFDPDFRQYGAGILLTLWGLELMCHLGIRAVDCGAGHHEWKERFRNHELATIGVQVPVSPLGWSALDWAWVGRYASQRLEWARKLRQRLAS